MELSWFLADICEVPYEHRVQCQCRDCGRSVYKAVHLIVWDDGRIETWGSTCYGRELGELAKQHAIEPRYGQGAHRRLTAAERALLAENRAALIAGWRREHEAELERARQAAEAERQRALAEQRREAEERERERQRRLEEAELRRQRAVWRQKQREEARQPAWTRPPERIAAGPRNDPIFQFILDSVCESFRREGVDPTHGEGRARALENASYRYEQCKKLGIDPRQTAG